MVTFGSVDLLHEDAVKFIEHLWDEAARYGGPGAFELTKTSSAWHEAGHAVVSATFGIVPTRVQIWRARGLSGRLLLPHAWVGRVTGTLPVHVDDDSPVESDHKEAVMALSGVVAEILFDPDFRCGSSLREVAEAIAIAGAIGVKTGTDEQAVYQDIYNDTVARLMAHEPIVRAIAVELMHKRIVRLRKLAAHLAPIARRK
jgi:hypothetical protein